MLTLLPVRNRVTKGTPVPVIHMATRRAVDDGVQATFDADGWFELRIAGEPGAWIATDRAVVVRP